MQNSSAKGPMNRREFPRGVSCRAFQGVLTGLRLVGLMSAASLLRPHPRRGRTGCHASATHARSLRRCPIGTCHQKRQALFLGATRDEGQFEEDEPLAVRTADEGGRMHKPSLGEHICDAEVTHRRHREDFLQGGLHGNPIAESLRSSNERSAHNWLYQDRSGASQRFH
jgi:hypothetical protein